MVGFFFFFSFFKKSFVRVIKYCTLVLAADPTNEKALFRRFQALKNFPERLEEARSDLAAAIRINPRR